MKLKHIAIIGSLFPILFSLVLFFGVLISADSDDENSNFSSGITGMNLSAEVLKHQPMVEKYARENGISEYVNVLLAIIQVCLLYTSQLFEITDNLCPATKNHLCRKSRKTA